MSDNKNHNKTSNGNVPVQNSTFNNVKQEELLFNDTGKQ